MRLRNPRNEEEEEEEKEEDGSSFGLGPIQMKDDICRQNNVEYTPTSRRTVCGTGTYQRTHSQEPSTIDIYMKACCEGKYATHFRADVGSISAG